MLSGLNLFHVVRALCWPAQPGMFRLWLALVVVLHHVTRIEVGKAPVLIFFALSGFWVHRVWQNQYAKVRAPWLSFCISRWWRIAPMMAVASVLSICAHAASHDADWTLIRAQPLAQSLLPLTILGYAQLATRPVGPAWSLDIEMQFYLVAPILIFFVQRFKPVWVFGLGYMCFVGGLWLGWGVTLPSFLIFFLFGLLASVHTWTVSQRLAQWSFYAPLGLVTLLSLSPWSVQCLKEGGDYSALLNFALALGLLPFSLHSVFQKSDRIDRMAGDFSYVIYLMHWPAIILLRFSGWGGGALAASILGLVVLSALLWRWYDRPIEHLRKRWVQRRMTLGDEDRRKRGDSSTQFA